MIDRSCVQVIVSSPGSPSSEESASPEPINESSVRSAREILSFNGNGTIASNAMTATTATTTTTTATATTVEQITPTSSVDTEEGHPTHPEEGERGVEGDAEASDDDHVAKRNNS